MDFVKLLKKERVLFDGGFGSMLYKRGMQRGDVPELFNVERPETVRDIYSEYAWAGAQVVTTNTLGANAVTLKKHGLDNRLEEIVAAAVRVAREGAGENVCVALSVGPTGEMLAPLGTLTFDEAYEAYRRQIVAGALAGADVVYMETMGDIAETRIAALAVKENTSLPFCCSFTYKDGAMMMGGSPECAALIFEGIGAAAVATNCTGEPEDMAKTIARYRSVCGLPFIAMPNAGLPEMIDGVAVYHLEADAMAARMHALLDAGATGIGGCCGTTPDHIAAFKAILDGRRRLPDPVQVPGPMLCSPRRHVSVKDAQNAMQEMPADPDALFDIEPSALAALIDMTQLKPADIPAFMQEAAIATHIPLCFRFARDEQAQIALRLYPGIAGFLGNVTAETQRRYGAVSLE